MNSKEMKQEKIKRLKIEIEELEQEIDRQDNNPRWNSKPTMDKLEKLRKELLIEEGN